MIRLGTRSSRLALAQASKVRHGLEQAGHEVELVTSSTLGDETDAVPIHRLGVAGAFTTRLEAGLLAERIDLAVHSLKDLPLASPEELETAAILERGPPQDVLVIQPDAHVRERSPPLARHARVATSGPRRQNQLSSRRPDLAIVNVRGNVDTRIQRLREGWFDALVTARAALTRMNLDFEELHVHGLDPRRFPPAPGQGAIAVQARADSQAARAAGLLDHDDSRRAVEAERRLLGHLGGGCGLPLGAWVRHDGDRWRLSATFGGDGWTPAHRPALDTDRREGDDPRGLAEAARRSLEPFEARLRRPSPGKVEAPEGPTVLVVASRPTANAWAGMLRREGYRGLALATRTFSASKLTDTERKRLREADWLLVTSRQAAGPLAAALGAEPPEAYLAAVGPASARALQREGLACHTIAPEADGDSLGQHVANLAEDGDDVVLVQGEEVHGRARLALDAAGVDAEAIEVYQASEASPELGSIREELPAACCLVMSPRNAQALASHDPASLAETFCAIGPSTAEALQEAGLEAIAASCPTLPAVLQRLQEIPLPEAHP